MGRIWESAQLKAQYARTVTKPNHCVAVCRKCAVRSVSAEPAQDSDEEEILNLTQSDTPENDKWSVNIKNSVSESAVQNRHRCQMQYTTYRQLPVTYAHWRTETLQ